MKIIYIAGPYRAETKAEIGRNIKKARDVAIKLWQEGWAVICPHMNTAHFEAEDDSIWINGGLEILVRCDAIYMLAGWEYSPGAITEWFTAQGFELDIYYEDELVRG